MEMKPIDQYRRDAVPPEDEKTLPPITRVKLYVVMAIHSGADTLHSICQFVDDESVTRIVEALNALEAHGLVTVRPGTFPPRYTFTDKGMEQFRNNNNVTPPIRDPMGLFTGILVAVALLASAAFAAYLAVSAIDWVLPVTERPVPYREPPPVFAPHPTDHLLPAPHELPPPRLP